MSTMMKTMSSSELLKLIDKQWADTNTIMKIGAVGKNKAINIKNQIRNELEENNYYLPPNLIPMESVLKYFKINVNYLIKIANSQKGI